MGLFMFSAFYVFSVLHFRESAFLVFLSRVYLLLLNLHFSSFLLSLFSFILNGSQQNYTEPSSFC